MPLSPSKGQAMRNKTHIIHGRQKDLTIGVFRHEIFAFHYRDPERKAGFLQKKGSDMD